MGLQVTRAERNMQMRLGGKHMARTLMVWFIAFAMAAPVFADTKNGNANAGSWQRWRFTSPGGETRATITWTNTGVADLFATVVCGSSTASFVTSFTRGGFDRIVNLTYGLGAGFPCVIFVRTGAGATSYRMSVRNAISQALLPTAATLQLIEDQTRGDYAEALADQTLDYYRLNTP